MKRSLVLWLMCTAGLTSVVNAESQQPLSWYSGDIKIDIYPQPGLCARRAESRQSSAVNEREGWQIESQPNQNAIDCFPFYSTAPDWHQGTLYVQAPGVLVQFKEGVAEDTIRQLFAQEQVQGEPRSLPRTYFMKEVQGERALRIAERFVQSGLTEFAQPNWFGSERAN